MFWKCIRETTKIQIECSLEGSLGGSRWTRISEAGEAVIYWRRGRRSCIPGQKAWNNRWYLPGFNGNTDYMTAITKTARSLLKNHTLRAAHHQYDVVLTG